jgi:uncharacterized protein (TIGR02996 family)
MHDEDGFLAAIRQTPADDVARLVFADWLDEQDDPTCKLKAEFIRLELRIANESAANASSLTTQLHQLATKLDRDWLVVISHPKIDGCRAWLERECPSDWSRLTPTRDPNARNCEACQKTVRYAQSLDDIYDYARRGYCTVITLALAHRQDNFASYFSRWFVVADLEREPLIERPRLPHTCEERCPDRQHLGEMLKAEEAELNDTNTSDDRPTPPSTRRKKGRGRFRNLQRENWEELE